MTACLVAIWGVNLATADLAAILGVGRSSTAGASLPDGAFLVIVIVIVVIAFASEAIRGDRQLQQLDDWAKQHGYRIVSRESRWLIRGPFFWSSGKHHSVYRIVAENRDGRRRDGWARVGHGFLWWPGRVDVRWDPPPPPPKEEPPGLPVIMPGDRSAGAGGDASGSGPTTPGPYRPIDQQ